MLKSDLLLAIRLIANALGTKPGTRMLAARVVRATAEKSGTIRDRLLALLAFTVLKAGTDRPKLDTRGEILVGVEVKPDAAHPELPVLVTTHQRVYRLSIEEAKKRGLRSHPRILSKEERLELRAILLAVRWGESVGLFETGMTVRADGSLEVGLHPAGVAGKLEDTELYQYRHDKTSDITRERWWYVLERDRTRRGLPFILVSRHEAKNGPETRIEVGGEFIEYPIFERSVRPGGGLVLRETGVARYNWDPNDPADRADEEESHGMEPLRRPTLEDNQLWRRPRYRLGWNIAAWERKGNKFFRISKDKVILLQNGDLWTPKDDSGNPEQDYFGDVRETLSWWAKEEHKRVTVKRWRKSAFWRNELTFVIPNEEVTAWKTVRGMDVTAAEAASYMARKDVITRRDRTVVVEMEGLLRAAIEEPAYDAVELVEKTFGFGSDKFLEAPCRRCTEKWGYKSPKLWASQPHAHTCNMCGSEVWRVMARVFVKRGLFPFLRMPTTCTHISAEVFGPWVMDYMSKGRKPGLTYVKELAKV